MYVMVIIMRIQITKKSLFLLKKVYLSAARYLGEKKIYRQNSSNLQVVW